MDATDRAPMRDTSQPPVKAPIGIITVSRSRVSPAPRWDLPSTA